MRSPKPLRRRGRCGCSRASFTLALASLLLLFVSRQLRAPFVLQDDTSDFDNDDAPLNRQDRSSEKLVNNQEPATSLASAVFNVTTPLRRDDNHNPIPNIAFVHVGKAGGMTLRDSSRLKCQGRRQTYNVVVKNPNYHTCMKRQQSSSTRALDNRLRTYIHLWHYHNDDVKASQAFLWVVRHPVDRAISAFMYAHPKACNAKSSTINGCIAVDTLKQNQPIAGMKPQDIRDYYIECFETLEAFAQATLLPNDASKTCRQRAQRLTLGTAPKQTASHLNHNYQYYYDKTMKVYNKTIYVLRTEELQDDVRQLDQWLLGDSNGNVESSTPAQGAASIVTHGSESYKDLFPISNNGYAKLCCALIDELELVETIVHAAVNLPDATKEQYVWSLYSTKCGLSDNSQASILSWKQDCRQRIDEAWRRRRNDGRRSY